MDGRDYLNEFFEEIIHIPYTQHVRTYGCVETSDFITQHLMYVLANMGINFEGIGWSYSNYRQRALYSLALNVDLNDLIERSAHEELPLKTLPSEFQSLSWELNLALDSHPDGIWRDWWIAAIALYFHYRFVDRLTDKKAKEKLASNTNWYLRNYDKDLDKSMKCLPSLMVRLSE